jgi:serine/threonine protein kinase
VPLSRAVVADADSEHVDLFVSPALRLSIAAGHPLLSDARSLAAGSFIAAERGQYLWDVDVAIALGAEPSDPAVREWRHAHNVPVPPSTWPKDWMPSDAAVNQARALVGGVPLQQPPSEQRPDQESSPSAWLPAAGLAPGAVLGSYRIGTTLGGGGMGVVYSAFEENLNRTVALKVITPHVANDEEARQRFIREARTAASIEHPHAVPIHAVGEVEGLLYIAMRQISGSSLDDVLEREVFLEPERAVRIIEQVADVLDAAHEAGVVHRDVKPQNILLALHGGTEHAYLSDFGLARLVQDTGLTRTGESLGTPSYMAPEQVRGDKAISSAADTYSLGCVLFECLTGVTPFDRESAHAVMFAHLHDEPPTASAVNTQSPSTLDSVLARALEKEPAERFESSGAFAQAARAAIDSPLRTA